MALGRMSVLLYEYPDVIGSLKDPWVMNGETAVSQDCSIGWAEVVNSY